MYNELLVYYIKDKQNLNYSITININYYYNCVHTHLFLNFRAYLFKYQT